MPIRNPFKKSGASLGGEQAQDEVDRPGSRGGSGRDLDTAPVDSTKPATALSIKGSREEPNEYKLSVVNDSGVYLPPSPPEKKSFWHRSHGATTPSNHRQMLSENEPFSISRESFESYRRSFDISARSPVIQSDATPPRQSLDSRTTRHPRSAVNERRVGRTPPTEEEGFEDVGLNDEAKPKRKGLFSRFGDSSDQPASTNSGTSSTHHGFHFTSRKRGHSGQGAELGKIEKFNEGPEVKADK